jgi:hypothetical protein
MSTTLRRSLALAIAVGSLAALTVSLSARHDAASAEFDALLVLYDREPDGPAKERLAAQIDAAAHQKYATVSRLYWHVDLESARAAARLRGRPILHLRLLGRLDEDLSCANSRLFRATLYADRSISAFLREKFVLYWSSERPVPRVTIDYGDGRKLERTTAGNSAHYLLDEDGHLLDVLPGLYSPSAFRRELEAGLALATRVRGASDEERARRVASYHQERVGAAQRDWERLSATLRISARPVLAQSRVQGDAAVAQLNTMSKAAIELRPLRQIARGLAPEALSEDQVELWSEMGRALYHAGTETSRVLDESSRSLIVRLHDAVPIELRATGPQRDAMIARLEQTIVADSAINQLRLRPQIGREIIRRGGRTDFATLNAWIYANVFRTPRQDAWLGLMPRNVFTGLPGDGVVMR